MKKMLRLIILGFLPAILFSFAPVKAQLFDEGDLVINAGIGIGSTFYSGTGYKTTLPPLFVSGDYCLREDLGPGSLGVGAYMGFNAYKWEYSYFGGTWGYKYSTFIIAGRGTYHFTDLVDNLDLYGGVLIGAKIVSSKEFGDYYGYPYSANSSGLAYSMFAGARYMFSDNFGVMAELGYGIAYLSIGVSLKF